MKVYQFHDFTCTRSDSPDLAAYGHAGWEIIAVIPDIANAPHKERYTFFLQRERPDWLTIKSGAERIDAEVIDGMIIDTFVTEGAHKAADLSDTFDNVVIDGTVNFAGTKTKEAGFIMRRLQRGQTSIYARIMTGGLALMLLGLTFITFT